MNKIFKKMATPPPPLKTYPTLFGSPPPQNSKFQCPPPLLVIFEDLVTHPLSRAGGGWGVETMLSYFVAPSFVPSSSDT